MMAIVAILFLQLLVVQQSHCKEICKKEACKEEAANMLDAMNKTIDPCDDFYEFACRGWISKNPIPRTLDNWDSMVMMKELIRTNIHNILDSPDKRGDRRPIKLARALYRSCMDLEAFEKVGMEPVRNALKQLGFPLTPPTDNQARNFDLGKVAGLARRYFGLNIFVGLDIRQNPVNSTSYLLMIQQPDFVLERLDIILRDSNMRAGKIILKRYMNDMLKLTGVGSNGDRYITEYLDFLTEMEKIKHQKSKFMDAPINIYQQISDPYATKWNWTSFIENVFKDAGKIVNSKFDKLTGEITYLKGFDTVVSKTPIETLVRAVYFHAFLTIAAEATYAGSELNRNLKKQLSLDSFEAKWIECSEFVTKHFHYAVTAAYVDKYFTPEQKKKAMEMWNDIRGSFDDMLNELQWMDASTKSQAHKKLHAMTAHIAYPDWITNPRKLDKYYAEYNVNEGKLYESAALANSLEIKQTLSKWRTTPDRSEWLGSVMQVNAFYRLPMNSVTIPVGILHIPFFGAGIDALNYGAIGAVLGHELTHGFDNDGRKRDANGNIRNWWSKDTLQHYLQKVECMIKQYSGYAVTQLGRGHRVNGQITQGENIADNGGLREAFRAYEKLKRRSKQQPALPGLVKYTDEQLFFLGYAQSWCASMTNRYLTREIQNSHPPNRYRAMGVLQNNDDFAKAFNCPLGSRMNPRNKCIVW